jgi:prepilin-type N-terminal cleavage/methylation domain-containing protein/prepilin-type processing-associated H-X9-DG protein
MEMRSRGTSSVSGDQRQSTDRYPSAARLRGFTLVELLVVISIIAILIALLLPALAKAKALSQEVVCASNMRQVDLAAYEYSQNNDGRGPSFMDGSTAALGSNCYTRWDQLLLPYVAGGTVGPKPVWNFDEWTSQTIETVYLCPTVASNPADLSWWHSVHNWTSYRINALMAGQNEAGDTGVYTTSTGPANPGESPVPLADVVDPSSTVWFMEGTTALPMGTSGLEYMNNFCPYPWAFLLPVHNVRYWTPDFWWQWFPGSMGPQQAGGSNIAFVDGHVASELITVTSAAPIEHGVSAALGGSTPYTPTMYGLKIVPGQP